ncbi:hypothetical protein EW145_g801 [Phellinidium pouzarii]|uniref:Uncharacterized protein n=1 Tax=Phellinidium pouzarii TaxID=167371 RepID=A0A4S4LGX3_9AGAM|nr:hypothetical protein EW145_g801 [Phellinidium pouzarii]
MDRLATAKKSLQDLETNNVIAPAWRNKNNIIKGLVDTVLGVTVGAFALLSTHTIYAARKGSSVVAMFYSLQGVIDTVQIFALIVSSVVSSSNKGNIQEEWKQVLLGVIPNVLALNFGSTVIQSLLFLGLLVGIIALFLCYFWSATNNLRLFDVQEGFLSTTSGKSGWGLILASFLLSMLYLPLSTIVTHALIWSDDFWVVPNPYVNATSNPPIVPPLGPSNEFYDPLDFCYTTTMKRNEFNYAPIIVIVSSLAFFFLTIWFPLRLHKLIKQAVPVTDRFTELGVLRSNSDRDRKYQRLLQRDRHPIAFLYLDFRRGWGTYRSFYLYAKLSALIIIAVVSSENCLFRNLSRTGVSIAREAILTAAMLAFFLIQCVRAPFIDPVNNASEWTSRLNYLLTSLVGLGVSINLPGRDILNGPVLYMYHEASGLQLDLSSSSPHVKRRIWQETISTIFLTTPDCKIPEDQLMSYFEARNAEYPPYLLDFKGSPAERHVENLKILREVGPRIYADGLELFEDDSNSRCFQERIQQEFVGPDMHWIGPEGRSGSVNSRFGTAWWIPFPPTLVMRYDDGVSTVLNRAEQFRAYVNSNMDKDIQRKRYIRLALRALDGQIVDWPYEYRVPIGKHANCCCGRRYQARSVVKFKSCVFAIKRKGRLIWRDLDLGSGFDIELTYATNVKVSKDALGLNDEWDLSPTLARFLALNQSLISKRLPFIEQVIHDFRDYHLEECYERFLVATSSSVATWWYIFWDDIWRRNYDTIKNINIHKQDFDPHYPTSIAYRPLPRPALETFLAQRGLYKAEPTSREFFNAGFLNKMYFRLNEIVFHNSSRAMVFHFGEGSSELHLSAIDALAHARSSSLGTGGGTDHDDSSIRARPNYRWEGILEDPLLKDKEKEGSWGWIAKVGVWFGLTPLWRTGTISRGLALDVKLEDGKYMIIG